ncbi:MAG: 5-formyltetrahydrofolate cyclo-ligase [Clostridia bacterium]|nr:5-formyltetrahydrofolate cyclo-ligase [Clostridia bacterium]
MFNCEGDPVKAGEKKEFRARIRSLAAQFDEEYITSSDKGITAAVMAMAEYQGAERLFAYSATGRECATREIIEDAAARGKTIALPVVLGDGQMVFAAYRGELHTGAYGISEPEKGSDILVPTERDIMIVPALCCDEEGFRLGRGGGYYDRYLAGCLAYPVCLCREKLLAERVPRDWNDLPVLSVITEKRVIRLCEDDRQK